MRYFLITYEINFDLESKTGKGSFAFKLDRFPSAIKITGMIKGIHPTCKSSAIIGIFEFKNEVDYLDYGAK